MCIDISLEEKETSLSIEGDIYIECAEFLQAMIREQVRKGCRAIRLNMEGVYYIDCRSLRLLADLQAGLTAEGVQIAFEHAREWTKRLHCLR